MPVVLAKKKRPTTKRRTFKSVRSSTTGEAWPLKESREEWLRHLRAEYTLEVCAQTLAINESLPVHGEP